MTDETPGGENDDDHEAWDETREVAGEGSIPRAGRFLASGDASAPPRATPSEAAGVAGLPEAVQHGMQQAIEGVTREERPRALALHYGQLWLVGYVFLLAAVVALAVAAHTFSVLPGDLGVERELQENRNPIVFAAMYAVSWPGYEPQAAIIFVLVVVGLWLVRLRLEAVFLALSVTADGIADLVKLLVARSRPSASLVEVVTHLSSYSFPSGHTVHYTVFYGFLAFVVATRFRVHWIRQVVVAICIALIVLVGFSRVYLGEHWPTDVLGGYLIGGLFLVPFVAAYLWAEGHVVVVTHWPFVERRDELRSAEPA